MIKMQLNSNKLKIDSVQKNTNRLNYFWELNC